MTFDMLRGGRTAEASRDLELHAQALAYQTANLSPYAPSRELIQQTVTKAVEQAIAEAGPGGVTVVNVYVQVASSNGGGGGGSGIRGNAGNVSNQIGPVR